MTAAVGLTDPAAATIVEWRRGRSLVARQGSVVLVRWTGVPSAAQLAALASAHRRASLHGEVVLVDVIASMEGRPVVERAIHDALLGLIRECRGRTCAVAHLVELRGPIGLAVRTFLGSLERVAESPRTKVATFDRIEPLARWLAALPAGAAVDPGALARAWSVLGREPSRQLAA